MQIIDIPFSEDLLDQQALSTAGGRIHFPESIRKPPVFRFSTLESYQQFNRMRAEMQKSAVEGHS